MMIIVNRKPYQYRQNPDNQEKVVYYVSGMVNWNMTSRPHLFNPPTDVLETDDKLIIRVEIAGVSSESLNVNFDQQILHIQGVRQDTLAKRVYHQMEVQFGEFSSEIDVSIQVDPEGIIAEYRDGFLIVELPKIKPTSLSIGESE